MSKQWSYANDCVCSKVTLMRTLYLNFDRQHVSVGCNKWMWHVLRAQHSFVWCSLVYLSKIQIVAIKSHVEKSNECYPTYSLLMQQNAHDHTLECGRIEETK